MCERTYREIGPDTYLISVMGGTIGWWVFKNIEEITQKTEENKNVTEEFDEVIDAISQIQGKTIKLERALRLLKSKNPDSRFGYLYYEAFGDEPVSREEAIERMKKRIKLLGERKEQIIRHLETAK